VQEKLKEALDASDERQGEFKKQNKALLMREEELRSKESEIECLRKKQAEMVFEVTVKRDQL